jgi:hypothetical protein
MRWGNPACSAIRWSEEMASQSAGSSEKRSTRLPGTRRAPAAAWLRSLDRLHQYAWPRLDLSQRGGGSGQETVGERDQLVIGCDQPHQAARARYDVKSRAVIFGHVLEFDQVLLQAAGDADDPFTAERQRHAQLVPGKRNPAHAQVSTRHRRVGPGGLHHCQ